ncbi:SHOCT domain-containing protein [Halorussus aquaticus]|uniref:SHOCT domain-containing protein n=1 Tax=Halorussus aquaticus TaxID=2953748 RepID=A0ABD5Q8N8_9EURY|nr:SHOCT domain-containing protein [Halorussus aquaticus]
MARQYQADSFLWIGLAILLVILFVPLLMMTFAMPMMGMMGWWNGGGLRTGFSPLWGTGMMVLFLVVLLGIGYLLYRAIVRGGVRDYDPALEELRTAYARGELSDEEYEQRLNRLQQDEVER